VIIDNWNAKCLLESQAPFRGKKSEPVPEGVLKFSGTCLAPLLSIGLNTVEVIVINVVVNVSKILCQVRVSEISCQMSSPTGNWRLPTGNNFTISHAMSFPLNIFKRFDTML